jgi:hypothetical protein
VDDDDGHDGRRDRNGAVHDATTLLGALHGERAPAAYARLVANIDDIADEVGRRAIDALYVGVGLGVLAFQKVQVRRRELTALLEQRSGEGRTVVRSVEQGLIALDDRAVALEAMVFERLEPALPEPARAAIEQARAVTATVRAQLRERLSQAAAI